MNTMLIDKLPAALGFVEPPELVEIGKQWAAAMLTDDANAPELADRYREAAEEVVQSYVGEDVIKPQIGLLIQVAIIRRDGGKLDQYLADLEDAIQFAWGAQLDDVVTSIQQALDESSTE